jgi:hypothetical protein
MRAWRIARQDDPHFGKHRQYPSLLGWHFHLMYNQLGMPAINNKVTFRVRQGHIHLQAVIIFLVG